MPPPFSTSRREIRFQSTGSIVSRKASPRATIQQGQPSSTLRTQYRFSEQSQSPPDSLLSSVPTNLALSRRRNLAALSWDVSPATYGRIEVSADGMDPKGMHVSPRQVREKEKQPVVSIFRNGIAGLPNIHKYMEIGPPNINARNRYILKVNMVPDGLHPGSNTRTASMGSAAATWICAREVPGPPPPTPATPCKQTKL